ncbi:MAG TPA: hypothetical protein PKM88_16055, partial [bacterium]|nr:hypothetical protein [bacterium]
MTARWWGGMAVVAVIASMLPRLLLAFAAGDDDLVRWMPDDAFYYLQIARQVTQGHGLTFDGTNPASGFHPLWLAWCIVAGGEVRTVAAGGMLLAVASAVPLWKLLRRWQLPAAGAAAGVALYALNPRFIINSVNGLETALVTFLWLIMLMRLAAWQGEYRVWWLVQTGMIGGGLWLARTDMIFVLLAVASYILWRLPNEFRGRGLACFAAGAVPLPLLWLGFHAAYFGTLIAGSADAIPYVVRHTDPLAVQGWSGHLQCGLGRIVQTAGRWGFITGWPLALPLLLAVVGGMLWCLCRTADVERWRWRLLALLWSAAAILFGVHAVLRLHPTHWYFETVAMLMLLTALLLVRHCCPSRGGAVVAGIGLIGLAATWPASFPPADYPWQRQLYRGAVWAHDRTPPDAVIGAFDAGILAYYSGRKVVNLDGVINDNAGRAIRARRLFAYMREQQITHYIDHDPFMRELFRPFFGDAGGLRYGKLATFADGISLNSSPVSVFTLTWDDTPA